MTRIALVVSTPWGSNRQETVFQPSPPSPSPMPSLTREAVNTAPVVQQSVGKHIADIHHVANSFSIEDSAAPRAGTRGQDHGGTPPGVQEEWSAFTGGGLGGGDVGCVPVGNAASDRGVAASRPDTDGWSRDAMELDIRSPSVGSSVEAVDDIAGLACERERFRGGRRDGRFSQSFEWRRRE